MGIETNRDKEFYTLHDLDSNLLATDPDIVRFHNERWNTDYTPDQFSEDFAKWWGVTQEVAFERWGAYCAERLEHIPAIEGASEAVANLSAVTDQDILTSRSAIYNAPTRLAVARLFPAIATVHHANIDWTKPDAPHRTKQDELAELQPDAYTEDQLKHCLAALKVGVPLIILHRTIQNQALEVPAGVTVSRSWSETEDLIAEAAERKAAAA